MSTQIADTYELVRAILGDFDSTYKRYTDAAIASVVRTVVKLGELPGYTVGNDTVSIEPTLATAKDLAILIYKTSLKLLMPNAASYLYETRAIKEKFGEQRHFVMELQEAIYNQENGDIFSSVQNLYSWLNGMTGLNLGGQLIDLKVNAPITTATVTSVGILIPTVPPLANPSS